MIQFSAGLRNGMLNNNGFAKLLTAQNAGAAANSGTASLYLFAGDVPETADAALNMATTHTLLGTVANVSFDAPANGIIQKNSGETWSTGAMAFSGANAASPTLQATFFRLCATGDNGKAAGTGTSYRMQGTIGTDMSFDAVLTNAIFSAGATETINAFEYQDGNF